MTDRLIAHAISIIRCSLSLHSVNTATVLLRRPWHDDSDNNIKRRWYRWLWSQGLADTINSCCNASRNLRARYPTGEITIAVWEIFHSYLEGREGFNDLPGASFGSFLMVLTPGSEGWEVIALASVLGNAICTCLSPLLILLSRGNWLLWC